MIRSVIIRGPESLQKAAAMAAMANLGDVVRIGKPTRTDEQNDKLHPMIRDIRAQVPGMETFTEEQIKLRFLDALGTEMTFLPKLEGEGLFPVGLRSSTLSKDQFSGLIELLYKFGAERGVVWSEPQNAIEARRAETTKIGSVEDESAVHEVNLPKSRKGNSND